MYADRARRLARGQPHLMQYAIVNVGEHAGIYAGIPTLTILVVLTDSKYTVAGPGDELLAKVRPQFPTLPGMLVSIEERGFRAYAHFQTHTLLAYLQIPFIEWYDLDLNAPIPTEDAPF
jgi:hypothetical protein